MEEIPCAQCGNFFIPRNSKQATCSADPCQQARKTAWHRSRLKTDPEYKEGQRLSQQKWQLNNPHYWREYRANNPQKADRNKDLQRVRNRRRKERLCYCGESVSLIAKMDASNELPRSLSGYFWLVPVIAKMDARKIFIHVVKGDYG